MKSSLPHSLLCFLLQFAAAVHSQSAVPTLPGFLGPLPFKLETGYIGVGENEEVQLFYYFLQSEGDPDRDPLLLWLVGGPGCSGLSAFVHEIGPLGFDQAAFDGSVPSLTLIQNPYSWTKVASIIFIDSPVGTGFSYATNPQAFTSNDTMATQHNLIFLKKWLSRHPAFLKNWLYIGGDSYGGKIVPMLAHAIAKDNEVGLGQKMLLQGYIVGNSFTEAAEDYNEQIPYAHRMGLVSDQYFELAKSSCKGEFVNPDPDNVECSYALRLVKECTKLLNIFHILEPKCNLFPPKHNNFGLVEDDPIHLISILSQNKGQWCRVNYPFLQPTLVTYVHTFIDQWIMLFIMLMQFNNYWPMFIWANTEAVQEALHIRKGNKPEWKRCNKSLSYNEDVKSVFEDHRVLNEKGFQILAYSGDHDMVIPYMSTLKWIRKLNLTVDEEWRPWTVDGQVAGYTETYKKHQAFLTFATVKGAGHVAPDYKPKECLEMVRRWLSLYPL